MPQTPAKPSARALQGGFTRTTADDVGGDLVGEAGPRQPVRPGCGRQVGRVDGQDLGVLVEDDGSVLLYRTSSRPAAPRRRQSGTTDPSPASGLLGGSLLGRLLRSGLLGRLL